MANLNRVILLGNVTRDVELRYTAGGTAVTDLGLAVNDKIKRDGQWVDEATYVDVTLWGRTAEVANEYLSKGSPVLIEGRLKYSTWEQDGQKRSKLNVVGERMQMVGGRGGGSGSGGGGGETSNHESAGNPPRQAQAAAASGNQSGGGSPAATNQIPEEDIPF